MSTPELRWIRPQLDQTARRSALAMISATELARHESLPAARRDSFLAGRLVLRRLVAELTDIAPEQVELVAVCPDCEKPHGKPVVVATDLQVSLAHRNDAVVAAASWGTAVGVDIERSDISQTALADIAAVAGEASLLRWTRVEAILKADGRGLRVDPSDIEFATVNGRLEGWVVGAPTRYLLSEVELAPDLTVSVAVSI